MEVLEAIVDGRKVVFGVESWENPLSENGISLSAKRIGEDEFTSVVIIDRGEETTITYFSDWVNHLSIQDVRYLIDMSKMLARWYNSSVERESLTHSPSKITTYRTVDEYVQAMIGGRLVDSLSFENHVEGSEEIGWMIMYVTDVMYCKDIKEHIYTDIDRNVFFAVVFSEELGGYVAAEGSYPMPLNYSDADELSEVLLRTIKEIANSRGKEYAKSVYATNKNYYNN